MVHILNIKEYAKEHNVPIMQDEGIEFICNYIKENKVKRVLEIGSAIGYSAICMASVDDDISVTTIERDIDRYNEAVINIKNCNLDSRITIYNADALDIEITGEYDLIFIDAAKSQYIKFFEKYKHNLSSNGVIISDNLSFHGIVDNPKLTNNRNTRQLVGKIKRYVEFLKNNEEFDTVFYPLGDGVSVSKKK